MKYMTTLSMLFENHLFSPVNVRLSDTKAQIVCYLASPWKIFEERLRLWWCQSSFTLAWERDRNEKALKNIFSDVEPMNAGRIRLTDRNKNDTMIRPNYNTILELEEEVPYWYLIWQQVRLKDVAKIFQYF